MKREWWPWLVAAGVVLVAVVVYLRSQSASGATSTLQDATLNPTANSANTPADFPAIVPSNTTAGVSYLQGGWTSSTPAAGWYTSPSSPQIAGTPVAPNGGGTTTETVQQNLFNQLRDKFIMVGTTSNP